MATLVNHDYESGASIGSFGYFDVSDLANTSGAGLRGSTWGLRGSGGSSAAYYAEARISVSPTGRNFSISADFDHVDSGDNGSGYDAFQLENSTGGWYLQLYHGVGSGADRSQLQINSPGGGPLPPAIGFTSDVGVIIPGTTQRLTLCGVHSTALGEEDGSVSLYVDGVLIVALTNVHIHPPDFGGNPTAWGVVHINAMGRFDNFLVNDDGCAAPIPQNDSTPCCAATPGPGSPGGVPGNTLGANPYIPLPEWSRQCAGGGTVPQVADETDSESWVV